MARTTTAFGLSFLVFIMLSACKAASEPADRVDAELAAARTRWIANRPETYEFTLRISCYCDVNTGRPTVVQVTGTTVTGAQYADDGTAVPRFHIGFFKSVDGLFDTLANARSNDFVRVDAVYDPHLGYPVRIALDQDDMIVDEEVSYFVSDFKAQ